MNLIFDIKHLIASINNEAWYWMYRIDDEFKTYASSIKGIKEYKKIHTLVIITEYYTEYKLFGKRHREDGPTFIWTYGNQEWYFNDKIHREDGPAVIWSDGSEEWWVNGEIHRRDGPAVIWSDGTQKWYVNGKRHREDGPATIWPDGREEWWLNGVKQY